MKTFLYNYIILKDSKWCDTTGKPTWAVLIQPIVTFLPSPTTAHLPSVHCIWPDAHLMSVTNINENMCY